MAVAKFEKLKVATDSGLIFGVIKHQLNLGVDKVTIVHWLSPNDVHINTVYLKTGGIFHALIPIGIEKIINIQLITENSKQSICYLNLELKLPRGHLKYLKVNTND